MSCPHCGHDNPAGARFCANCGRPLAQTCPSCGQPAPAQARFCPHCGSSLGESRPRQGALEALRSQAPQALMEKVRDQAQRIEQQRKLVTVLFADIVGSTALAETLDPEEWGDIVTGVHERIGQAVYRYEGTIAQLLGDGVLAFFGAPLAHEDDAERALLAGLEMVESVRAYAAGLGRELQIRVGLNTGLVVVGSVGSDLHMEYLALGDTVNLAARVQGAAEPGTVLASDATRRLAGSAFRFEDRGPVEVKGKAQPVRLWRVTGRGDVARARGIEGLSAPLVGREAELTALLSASEELTQGRGRAVAIVAEAGLGKSRLVAEWRRAAGQGLSWVEGRCLSYTASTVHHLSRQILRGLTSGDPQQAPTPAELRQAMGPDSPGYEVLAHLLGLDLDPETAARIGYLDGPSLQSLIIDAFGRLLARMAQASPAVVVCDDLHWSDRASVELLSHLVSLVSQAPVAFVFISRPDRDAPGWALLGDLRQLAGPACLELHLDPLTHQHADELISHLLTIPAFPGELRQRILNKAEGNPFFVEEVLRMLIDRGLLSRRDGQWVASQEIETLEVPDTLRGVLMARIDRLPEEARQTLQLASVIGRRFPVRLLESVVDGRANGGPPGADPTLIQALSHLEGTQLLRRLFEAEPSYAFKHTLTQETAYRSLLLKTRRDIHGRVARSYERLYPERLDDLAAQLAHHFAQARDDQKTLEYAIRAGDGAARVYATREAAEHYGQALELALRLEAPSELIIGLYHKRGRNLELSSRFREALELAQGMETLAAARGDRAMELASLIMRSNLRANFGPFHDPPEGMRLAERGMALARQLGDRQAEARLLWVLSNLNRDPTDPAAVERCIEYGEASLRLARELGLREQTAYALNDLSYGYLFSGQTRRAIETVAEAEALWRELGNLPMLTDGLATRGQFLAQSGRLEEAYPLAREAQSIATEIGNLWGQAYSRWWFPHVLWQQGRVEEAAELTEELAHLSQVGGLPAGKMLTALGRSRMLANLGALDEAIREAARLEAILEGMAPAWRSYGLSAVAEVRLLAGDLPGAEGAIARAVEAAPLMDFLARASSPPAILGQLELARGRPQAALERLDERLATLEEAEMGLAIPETQWLRAGVLLQLDRPEEARGALADGRTRAEPLEMRWWLWQILDTLADLEADPERSRELRREADQLVRFLLDHAGKAELRQAILTRTGRS